MRSTLNPRVADRSFRVLVSSLRFPQIQMTRATLFSSSLQLEIVRFELTFRRIDLRTKEGNRSIICIIPSLQQFIQQFIQIRYNRKLTNAEDNARRNADRRWKDQFATSDSQMWELISSARPISRICGWHQPLNWLSGAWIPGRESRVPAEMTSSFAKRCFVLMANKARRLSRIAMHNDRLWNWWRSMRTMRIRE